MRALRIEENRGLNSDNILRLDENQVLDTEMKTELVNCYTSPSNSNAHKHKISMVDLRQNPAGSYKNMNNLYLKQISTIDDVQNPGCLNF